MFNWNDQVGDTLWGDHKEIEDHIVPRETEGNSLFTFGELSKKHRNVDDGDLMSSTMETFETKQDFLICNAKNSYGTNADQELDDSSLDIDTWTDLPTLGTALSEGFNDANERDSIETGLANDLGDASELNSGAVTTGYNRRCSSSLSRPFILLTRNEMRVNGEHELFGHGDKENDRFLDYDWANFENFDDLDMMFRSNGSIFGNDMMDNADTFLTASTDVISSIAQSIPVPDLPKSGKQLSEKDFSSSDLVEQSDLMMNTLQKDKTADVTIKAEAISHTYLTSDSSGFGSQMSFKADLRNQTTTTQKNAEGKGKAKSSPCLNNSWSNKNQKVSNPTMQASSPNPLPMCQSKPIEQISSLHQVAFADYGFSACQFSGMPMPPQLNSTFEAHPEYSKHPKATVPQPVIMTPKEKIEKLRRRQQMQAMFAIQKQREHYSHQISGNDDNQDKEDYIHKFPSSDVSSIGEQDQSQIISSSADGSCVEEAIYYQLQDALGKLDMRVRLNIGDSLYRLARSAMERQSASDRSRTSKSNKEEDISDDEESNKESNNQDRYAPMRDSEAVTNPIDRIVAHLLFHNPSCSPISNADGSMSMATSM